MAHSRSKTGVKYPAGVKTCGQVLKDNEIEFDHIIPVAKGGSSEEHNVRVACFDCNRSKSDAYEP